MKTKRQKQDRVVVITGGSAGVGRAIAEAFAQQGAKVGVIARGEDKLDSTRDELTKMGAAVRVYSADVSKMEEVEAAAHYFEKELGPIDLWVNNAMASVFAPVKEMTADDVRRVTDVTYLGSVNGTLAALKRMLPTDRGHIIQIGSALAYQSIPLQAAYCGAKHGMHGFLESLRIELKHDKSSVKVSELQLPAVNTPQFEWVESHLPDHPMPVPPIFQPEVVARAVLYLADHPRREMWLGGSTVKAIVASKFAPRIADWYLSRNGYQSQQTKELPPTHDNNVWEPVNKDYGAHGSFDDKAKKLSWQYLANVNRLPLAIGTLLLAGTGLILKKR